MKSKSGCPYRLCGVVNLKKQFMTILFLSHLVNTPSMVGAQISSKAVKNKYGQALSKSLLFFEAQRSGKLPQMGIHRHAESMWRGNSGLDDGYSEGVDLTGGYYDAGDNVKFTLPMAFTATMLAWALVEYRDLFSAAGELRRALFHLKWATDFLLKAHSGPTELWAEVGDGTSDHECWMRPENMTTDRTAYKIDEENPGSDLAGETAAALAAASMVFKAKVPHYAEKLLYHARQLYNFAINHKGKYSDSVPIVRPYYKSVSGNADELLWAGAWLYRATQEPRYGNEVFGRASEHYVIDAPPGLNVRHHAIGEFSWDNKVAGAQVLISIKALTDPTLKNRRSAEMESYASAITDYREMAERYLCDNLHLKVNHTPDGLIWIREWAPMQYAVNAAFLAAVYSDYLEKAGTELTCYGRPHTPNELLQFAVKQVNYALGENSRQQSFLVGWGPNPPLKVHHRAASLPDFRHDSRKIGCKDGYDWLLRSEANPNEIVGALMGGPDHNDMFYDDRKNYAQSEPNTYMNAVFAGLLARLSAGVTASAFAFAI